MQKIFVELGFDILESNRNRDDLIVKYKDRIAVIEIKGVNSSAAEKHAAQLEKWVAAYYESNEIKPKGILIVNAFKDAELKLRVEKNFPDQMLKFSEQREHCLISSVQLLGMYYQIQKDPSTKEELIETLFSTIGLYKGFENWTSFIEF